MSKFSEKERIAYTNIAAQLFDNLRIAKAFLLDKAVTALGYTTSEIAQDINSRSGHFELKTINHEITNLNQYILYDNYKQRAFIIMQGIDSADFEHGYSIEDNKEVSFNYYR